MKKKREKQCSSPVKRNHQECWRKGFNVGWSSQNCFFSFLPPTTKSHFNQTPWTTSSLDGRNIFPLLRHRNCLQLFTSNPIKSCIVFISEICYFRKTEIFSQRRRGAEICKYVFGSVPVTMFSWCFFFFWIWNCLLPLWELKKKKKKKLYVNLSKYSKENKNWP